MVSVRNANAMAEVIYYLKGIRKEDIDKIPKKIMNYLNENASKNYICNFDYNKPLKELNLLDETREIISLICYNYWCIDEKQKEQYLKKISQNEQQYQKILYEKYNPDDIFKKNKSNENINETKESVKIVEYKEQRWYEILFTKILKLFKK